MKKKILIYSDCFFFAGCENIIINILSHKEILKDFDVVFAYRYSKDYERGLNSRLKNKEIQIKKIFLPQLTTINKNIDERIKNHTISKGLKGIFFVLQRLRVFFLIDFLVLFFFLLKMKPDIIHVNNGGYPGAESCLALILASYFIEVDKMYLHVNNIAACHDGILKTLNIFVDRLVFRRITKFITASLTAGEKLIERRNAPRQKWMQIYNTIIPRDVTLSKNEYLKKYNISSNKVIFSVIANFEKRKGHIFILDAVKQIIVKQNLSDKFMVILEGSGDEFENIKNMIRLNGLEKNIIMIGREENIMNLMNTMDVLVVPSIDYEDFPNVVIESMYLGKPVIGTRIAGIVEQIDRNRTGLLIEPKNSDEIKNAMIYYINNRNKIIEHGNNAQSKFNKLFKYEVIMKELHDLYQ